MEPIRSLIASQVRGIFTDRSGRAAEISREDDGLFGPGSVSWRVHGDVTSMMIGGVAALLLQMLHPLALAGIWDHSNFRRDMHGRLRRTAAFIAVTTYGSQAQAEAAIARVRRIHDAVEGALPDGTPYAANDPELLAYVHVAEAYCFLKAYMRYRDPLLLPREQDRYLAEIATVAERLGAPSVPTTRHEVERYFARVRPQLRSDARTREAARILLSQPPPKAALLPFQAITQGAGVDLLPGWARRLHGFGVPLPARPLVRAGAGGLAAVLRWAMARPATP